MRPLGIAHNDVAHVPDLSRRCEGESDFPEGAFLDREDEAPNDSRITSAFFPNACWVRLAPCDLCHCQAVSYRLSDKPGLRTGELQQHRQSDRF